MKRIEENFEGLEQVNLRIEALNLCVQKFFPGTAGLYVVSIPERHPTKGISMLYAPDTTYESVVTALGQGIGRLFVAMSNDGVHPDFACKELFQHIYAQIGKLKREGHVPKEAQ